MRIMFMGTPDISRGALAALIEGGHDIVAVVTGEDKPRGRGNVMTPTPTKKLAQDHGIPVYTPKSLRTEEFAAILSEVSPEMIVVVAYGKILPKNVIDFPPTGCLNVHVSLLPKYRGAAPMQRAIMEGESETGVTIMYMDEGLDTGDIISVLKFPIGDEDNFEDIHDRSAELGAKLLSKTVTEIFEGRATRTPQDSSLATYAKKIEKSDAKIDFAKSAREIDLTIRGTTPIPGAFAYLGGKMLKICKAIPTDKTNNAAIAGEVLSIDGGVITVACGVGALLISSVIPEGKSKMSAADFIRGRKTAKGDILE